MVENGKKEHTCPTICAMILTECKRNKEQLIPKFIFPCVMPPPKHHSPKTWPINGSHSCHHCHYLFHSLLYRELRYGVSRSISTFLFPLFFLHRCSSGYPLRRGCRCDPPPRNGAFRHRRFEQRGFSQRLHYRNGHVCVSGGGYGPPRRSRPKHLGRFYPKARFVNILNFN